MPSTPFLNINDGDTVEVQFTSNVRSKQNEAKGYMMHFYDVKMGGKEYTINASPGLHKLLEEDAVGPGSVAVISRKGEGLETRWRVRTDNGGRGSAPAAIPEETRGRPRGPAPARAPTREDLASLFRQMLILVQEVNADEGTVLTGDGLYAAAASLTGTAMDYGIRPAAKETPSEFIAGIFKRAGISAADWDDFSQYLFSKKQDDLGREDATMLWNLSEGGKNLAVVLEQFERMQADAIESEVDIDEFPPEEDMPF